MNFLEMLSLTEFARSSFQINVIFYEYIADSEKFRK